MTITKDQLSKMRTQAAIKSRLSMTEAHESVNEHTPTVQRPRWIPADQAAMLEAMTDILKEIKGLREDLKRK